MYQRLVGRLTYLSPTRSNIAYAVGIVNQFMHNPKEVYLRAMVQILQHLKGTPGKGILFRKGEKNVFRSLYRHRLCKFSSQ